MSGRWWHRAVTVGALAGLGCDSGLVAVVHARVTTDLADASWIELRIVSQDGARVTGRDQRAWPSGSEQSFNLVPRGRDLAASPEAVFEVVAGSCGPVDRRIPDACVLVTRRARVAYVAGEVVETRLTLDGACRGVNCGAGQTCAGGGCVSERGGGGATDAGGVGVDVGPADVGMDVGLDAGIDAADSCTPRCGGRSCGNDGCGGSCGTCTGGDLCSPPGTCIRCVVGTTCSTGNPCEIGRTLCGEAGPRCEFSQNQPASVACGTGAQCDGRGTCIPCNGTGRIVCDGACTDPSSDPSHCGACGTTCSSGRCVAGACTATMSDGGPVDAPRPVDAADGGGAIVCPVGPSGTQTCTGGSPCCLSVAGIAAGCGCRQLVVGCIPCS